MAEAPASEKTLNDVVTQLKENNKLLDDASIDSINWHKATVVAPGIKGEGDPTSPWRITDPPESIRTELIELFSIWTPKTRQLSLVIELVPQKELK